MNNILTPSGFQRESTRITDVANALLQGKRLEPPNDWYPFYTPPREKADTFVSLINAIEYMADGGHDKTWTQLSAALATGDTAGFIKARTMLASEYAEEWVEAMTEQGEFATDDGSYNEEQQQALDSDCLARFFYDTMYNIRRRATTGIGQRPRPGCALAAKAYAQKPAEQVVSDAITNPTHYQLLPGVEVIDVRERLLQKIETAIKDGQIEMTLEQIDAWSRAWEYMTRFMEKGGMDDLLKAENYLHRCIHGEWKK